MGKGVALNSAVSVFKTNMISERKNFLSKKGLEKIQKELEKLRSERLFRIKGDAPKSFRFGDIDPEYLMFQEEVRRIEKKINELEDILENHEIIKAPEKGDRNKVYLGARVLVDMDGAVDEFVIVGTIESDPANKMISDESPMGQVLLGKRTGDQVEVKTPMVTQICKIVKISYESN